jgi:hypothetical protein
MSTMRKWAELASQNERLALPSDQSSELAGGTVGAADRQSRGQARNEPEARPDASGRNVPLARSA